MRAMAVLLVVLVCGCGGGGRGEPPWASVPTRDEYVQAMAEMVACIEDRGLTASSYEQDDGSLGISIGSPRRDDSAVVDRAYDACYPTTLEPVEPAYLASIHPDGDDAWRLTKGCLVDAGVVDPGAPDAEVEDYLGGDPDPDLFDECVNSQYTTTTTVPGG